MNHLYDKISPFEIKISFEKVIEVLEEIAKSNVDYRATYAKGLLKEIEPFPELRNGVESYEQIEKHFQLIKYLLSDLFPTALTKNEIKAVTVPFYNYIFNISERFEKIIEEAGENFEIIIRDFDEHQFYVMNCTLILNYYYGQKIDFSNPIFYDIPDKDGVVKHYRILYNADFMDITPTEKAVNLTQDDIFKLLDNYDDLELWKEKFPVGSWQVKGFGIMTLYDNTVESAISSLKSSLLSVEDKKVNREEDLESVFRSIFKVADLKTGFTAFSYEGTKFKVADFKKNVKSYILYNGFEEDCDDMLGECSMDTLLGQKKFFVISDVQEFLETMPEEKKLAEHLLAQNIHSCILAPLIKNNRLLGIIELVSSVPKQLNSINANKLDLVMPFLVDTIDRVYTDIQNQIEAIIQKEYTAIHPSVYWKFRQEASLHTSDKNNRDLPFKEIVFKEVFPLYGQIDIKGSSTARNNAIQKDLSQQLSALIQLLKMVSKELQMPVIYQNIFELEAHETQLNGDLKADTESIIQNYILNEVHPILEHFKTSNGKVTENIASYFSSLDPKINMVYSARKDFDETLSLINKKMASLLDKKQEEAQSFFPHYYERFKTDGVEHNLYIGASIAPLLPYNPMYLSNLRLWQLQALCELENEYYQLRPTLRYELDVTSLILVFSQPISIRFRMDEKRFDVDGTYNARYEVVKKRIDKSNIKGTNERITQKGKITIVYSQNQEEAEYKRYIKLLQHKKKLGKVETFEVEDLQGVTGLKALRVEILYNNFEDSEESYTFQDLLKELPSKN